MSYNPVPKIKEGGQCEAIVTDDDAQGLLLKILREIKMINIHLSYMTDEMIHKEDIE